MFSEDFKKTNFQRLDLKDGEKTLGVFAGEPLEFMNNFKLKEEFPIGLPSYPDGTGKRFRINVLTPSLDGKKFIPLIMAGPPSVAITLDTVTKKYGMDYLYEISVSGTGTKKKTAIFPERALTEEEKAMVKATTLIPLKIFEKKGE